MIIPCDPLQEYLVICIHLRKAKNCSVYVLFIIQQHIFYKRIHKRRVRAMSSFSITLLFHTAQTQKDIDGCHPHDAALPLPSSSEYDLYPGKMHQHHAQ